MFSRLRHDAILVMFGIALLFQLTYTAAANGQDKEAESRAALALAKAKREREQAKAKTVALACHSDYTVAAAEAARSKKPLVLWVGVKCSDIPELRKALSEAVHCHLAIQRGDDTPRIVIQGGDGVEYYVRPERIADDTAAKIRQKWELPYVPPRRADILIAEEFTFVAPPPYYSFSSPALCIGGG